MATEKEPVIYRHTFYLRPLEADPSGGIRHGLLTDFLQQSAWIHAEKLGVGTPLLISKGLTWVLNRLMVNMKSEPESNGPITIETWPSGTEKIFVYRNFRLIDHTGTVCGSARSAWLVVDINRKRAVSPPDFIKNLPVTPEEGNSKLYTEKLPLLQKESYSAAINVRRQDIDINDHVNNNVLIQWFYECLPYNHGKIGPLKELDIQFKAECHYGDEIISSAEATGDGFLHLLKRKSDGAELATGRTVWLT